ncbi:MAG: histidine kinase N-terminal 7TM domain-containing protein [Methanoregula sp.]|nr:histidine kinase N-terminal 7TM domain-containing protein [Methanoregula sp.]
MLIISGISMACLGLYGRRFVNLIPAAIPYTLLMFSACAWAILYALELLSESLPLKILFHNLRFLILPFIAVIEVWLVFAFVKRTEWVRKDWAAAVLIIPVAAAILGCTSPLHTLFRYNFSIDSSGSVSVLHYSESPFYSLYILYSLVLLILAILILIVESRRRKTLWQEQTILLLIAIALPTVINYLFIFGVTPVQGINMTAPLLWISAILYTAALFRYRFLDILPIARSRLIENMSTPMLVLDTSGRIIDLNPAACSLFSTTLPAAVGKPVNGIASDWPDFLMLCRSDRISHSDLTCNREDGIRFYTASVEQILTHSGEPEAKLILLQDVTEQKRAEKALRESESFNRGLVENLPEYVIVYGPAGNILYVNPAAERALGYNAVELTGTSVLSYVAPEYRTLVTANMATRLKGSNPPAYEADIIAHDGIRRTIIANGTPIQYHDSPAILLLLIDISERKRAEDALALANKKLNLLSGITRHDINNQLTVLMGFLTILKMKQPDPSLNDYFVKVSNAALRISSMIQFTREYENIGVNAPVWQDCHTLVDTAAKQAPLGNVVVKNDLPASTEVFADPLVVKVFYNLMDNAVRYGGKITTIRFSVEQRDGDHLIVCEDDGDGVVAEEKEKIFERGFGKNTGLGLALAQEILDITGITIKECGEPGKGARFEMTVPKGAWRINDTK